MKNNSKRKLGFIFIILSILCLLFLYISPDILIPAGYELALDGYVLSKNILLITIFVLISKIGFLLISERN